MTFGEKLQQLRKQNGLSQEQLEEKLNVSRRHLVLHRMEKTSKKLNLRRKKMKLTMLGTGNALVTEYYNTCFILEEKNQLFLVDGGGGNTLLCRIRDAGYNWMNIHHIFVTHKHIDHLLGIIWMMRLICQHMKKGEYTQDAYIYSHGEVLALLKDMAEKLLQKNAAEYIGNRLHLVEVTDGETLNIIGHDVTFFDIKSTKAKQFGFCMELEAGRRLTCCGDEPLTESLEHYARGSEWLLHEAFCLHSQAEIFHPYEKHHSTVKDACELAEKLGIKNLLLYHTEDKTFPKREEIYRKEGEQYFKGTLWIPNDLDSVSI